jgi:hypothetical protein
LSPSKAEKSNTSAKGLLGIVDKLMIVLFMSSFSLTHSGLDKDDASGSSRYQQFENDPEV